MQLPWTPVCPDGVSRNRLALPVRAANGRLQHLVTISDELARAPIDTLAGPGLATRRASNGRWLTLIE
jgi:hypothetical protein